MNHASVHSIWLSMILAAICQGQPVDESIARLKDADPTVRRLAAEKLGKEQVLKAIPALCELLKDDNPAVTTEAVNALAQMGKPSTAALVALLGTKIGEKCQLNVLWVLDRLGASAEDATPTLIKLLKNQPVDVRIHAAFALGRIGKPAKAALPALFEAAKDTSNLGQMLRTKVPSSVTDAAVEAALKIDPNCTEALAREALPDLMKALQSKDQGTLYAASFAIGKLGAFAKPAANALLEAEKNAKGFAANAISSAIEMIGIRSPLDAINDPNTPIEKRLAKLSELRFARNKNEITIKGLTVLLKDKNPKIRNRAAMVLGQWAPESKSAVPDLLAALGDLELESVKVSSYNDETSIVPQALSQFGRLVVVDLASVLKDSKQASFKRWSAAKALSLIGRRAEAALPVLKEAVKDQFVLIGLEASCAYMLAGGDFADVKASLEQGLKQKQDQLVFQALTAIERIGYPASTVTPLLQPLLSHKEREIRIRAAHALAAMREVAQPAVFQMAELLSSKDARERFQILTALQNLGEHASDALPVLIKQLGVRETMMPNPVLTTIGKIGPKAKSAVPELLRLLKDGKLNEGDVAKVLGQIGPGSSEAVPVIAKLLSNKSDYIRGDTAWALGQIGPGAKQAIPALKGLLSDAKKTVRIKAMYALIMINDDVATYMPELIKLWKESGNSDPNEFSLGSENIRSEVADVWVMLGKKAKPAMNLMLEAISDKKTDLGTVNLFCKTLAKQTDETYKVMPKLIAILEEPDDQRNQKYRWIHASVALGMIGPQAKQAIPSLKRLTKQDDKQVVDTAYEALGKIDHTDH